MAFTDPITLTIATVANVLKRTVTNATSAIYSSTDGNLELELSHQKGAKRIRSVARVNRVKISADPLTTVNIRATSSLYVVFDRPLVGFTNTEHKDDAAALFTWLTASSNANLLKVLELES